MTNRYSLSARPLAASNAQLRWNIDSSSNQELITLSHGRVEVRGWLLTEDERSPRLVIKNDYATYSYPFNVKRPDVIAAILQQPEDNHPRLNCGFKINVPFSSQITLGLESDGLITWLTELNFSPA